MLLELVRRSGLVKRCIYSVSNFTVLQSKRPRPEQSERVERNEGVAIVLDQQMCGEQSVKQ